MRITAIYSFIEKRLEKKMKKISLVLILLLFTQGCAAALVGGLLYKSSKSKKARQEFISTLHQTNMQRESNGLEPLDYCTEALKFDRKWALKTPECRPVKVEEEIVISQPQKKKHRSKRF